VSSQLVHNIGGRRAWVVWGVSVAVYVVTVFHRSSLGVAGLLAVDRFGISATQLAFFTVLQLLVYAGMQIPVGVLLDRFGSRRMLLTGLVLMSSGQLVFAFATSFPVAVLARAVVGAGDAMIFVSAIRLITVWFLIRQTPFMIQLTGAMSQVGAILAAAPLTFALHSLGWTKTFAIASALGLVLIGAVLGFVKDSPYGRREGIRLKLAALARSLSQVWGHPGTRHAMWTHFTTQFSVTVFAMLWGFPFLVRGEGLSTTTAGLVMALMAVWIMISGFGLTWLVAHHPYHRSAIAIGVVALMVVVWTVVLLRSEPAPLWLLILLVCSLATGGPASMIGFDLARTWAPVSATGRANGVVNIGGFVAGLVTLALIGLVLDWRAPGGQTTYDLDDFRVAFCVQYPVWILGVTQILRYRRRSLILLRREHPGVEERLRSGEQVAHVGMGDLEGV